MCEGGLQGEGRLGGLAPVEPKRLCIVSPDARLQTNSRKLREGIFNSLVLEILGD